MSFVPVLEELCGAVKGARGACFVDYEGECVQQHVHDPTLDPYDLQVAGAHAAPLMAHGTQPQGILVNGGTGRTFIVAVKDLYAVVLLARPDTLTGPAVHHVQQAVARIRELM